MRILVPASLGLAVVSCVVSAILWVELKSDRQLIDELRTQLVEARAAPAVSSSVPAVVATATTDAVAQPAVTDPVAGSPLASAPAKITRDEAVAAITADTVKRQKTLLADAEYRKALLAQARVDLQTRYSGLGMELGLSQTQVNALFDLLAESQLKMTNSMAAMTSGAQPTAAESEAMGRLMHEQQQKLKDDITALIGPERYTQFEEYERMQPARTRVSNLTTLLARSERPLTTAQTRSLTAVMIGEQKRMEAEAKALRDAGKTETRSPADIQVETNRRILELAPAFLDDQQLQVVRGRFQQRATIDRAADAVQQREREVLQDTSD